MDQDIREKAIQIVFAQDPQRSAQATLSLLMPRMNADVSALFRCVRAEKPELIASVGVFQPDLDWASAAWGDGQESIVAGHSYTDTDDSRALVPIGGPGVVYLRSKARLTLSMGVISRLSPLLASSLGVPEALEVQPPSPVVVDVEATETPAFERERLQTLLERHEWVIARVARILGVERSTVYRRLARLGIPRRKVQKRR